MTTITVDHVESAFRETLTEHGLAPADPTAITADGELHRFDVAGDRPGRRNGWYRLHADAVPAGVGGSWKTGEQFTWCARRDNELTPDERRAMRERIEAARTERDRCRQHEAQRAAQRARRIYDSAAPASPSHPYLVRKGIEPPSRVRQHREHLIVPLYSVPSSELVGLQNIGADGGKRFGRGTVKRGAAFPIDGDQSGPLVVAEGVATAATIAAATGWQCVAALDAGNLEPIAAALRAKYPERLIILAADRDGEDGGVGVRKAKQAAEAVGGRVAIPAEPGDWNDAALKHGRDSVAAALQAATEPAATAPENSEVTGVTGVTAPSGGASGGYLGEKPGVTGVTNEDEEPNIERPAFMVHDTWFRLHGQRMRPGLYWHGWRTPRGKNSEPEPVDTWVCTPIHADATTADEAGAAWGLMLRFANPRGQWREWAAPLHLLKGSGEELRGELLDLGVRIDPKNRALLSQWMMAQYPRREILAATRTGWHDTGDGHCFVMPNRTIDADHVRYQSEHASHNDYSHAGTLNEWQRHVAMPCRGNTILLLAVSASLTGPTIKPIKQQDSGGAGLHLVGDSSKGKTTALQVAASPWGPPAFVRTWRATANGLEATAAALNDTAIVLDEISECDPREIGAIVYALANGAGKQRAQRTGGAKATARWRVMALSSGERTLASHMFEAGRRVRAGQEVRLLDVPATNRRHGVFDGLAGHADGRAFADHLKQQTGKCYGTAGPAFVKGLLTDHRDLPKLYADACNLPEFAASDGLESRAAGAFALIGLAGELASEYGITGWSEGEAMSAAVEGFKLWRDFRGTGGTENNQIQKGVREFIARHGDSRFSSVAGDDSPVRDRAGYWRDDTGGRIYLFNSAALQEAAPGFDIRRILDALDTAGWIADNDHGKRSKRIKVAGATRPFYAIRPDDGAEL